MFSYEKKCYICKILCHHELFSGCAYTVVVSIDALGNPPPPHHVQIFRGTWLYGYMVFLNKYSYFVMKRSIWMDFRSTSISIKMKFFNVLMLNVRVLFFFFLMCYLDKNYKRSSNLCVYKLWHLCFCFIYMI